MTLTVLLSLSMTLASTFAFSKKKTNLKFRLSYFLILELSIVAHHIEATGNVDEWRCQTMFENLTAQFGQLDTTPWGLLLTTPAMALNSRCANQCVGTANPPEWWATGADLCNFNSTDAITCYCAKDKNGGCARALRAGSFSHEPTACVLSAHSDRVNVLRFVMDVTFKDSAVTAFETRLARGFTSAYECDDVAADDCQFQQSCGAWHAVHNTLKVTAGDAASPCDADCTAKPAYCDSLVCWKNGTQCFAAERLLTSADQPVDCDLVKPAKVNCSAPHPEPIDPFVRAITTKLTTTRDNLCCSKPAGTGQQQDTTASGASGAPVATSSATRAFTLSIAAIAAVPLAHLAL
jgi:hypothetical protein